MPIDLAESQPPIKAIRANIQSHALKERTKKPSFKEILLMLNN